MWRIELEQDDGEQLFWTMTGAFLGGLMLADLICRDVRASLQPHWSAGRCWCDEFHRDQATTLPLIPPPMLWSDRPMFDQPPV